MAAVLAWVVLTGRPSRVHRVRQAAPPLLDTLDDLADSTNHALALHGLPERSREEIRQFVGNGVGRLLHLAVPAGTSRSAAR